MGVVSGGGNVPRAAREGRHACSPEGLRGDPDPCDHPGGMRAKRLDRRTLRDDERPAETRRDLDPRPVGRGHQPRSAQSAGLHFRAGLRARLQLPDAPRREPGSAARPGRLHAEDIAGREEGHGGAPDRREVPQRRSVDERRRQVHVRADHRSQERRRRALILHRCRHHHRARRRDRRLQPQEPERRAHRLHGASEHRHRLQEDRRGQCGPLEEGDRDRQRSVQARGVGP